MKEIIKRDPDSFLGTWEKLPLLQSTYLCVSTKLSLRIRPLQNGFPNVIDSFFVSVVHDHSNLMQLYFLAGTKQSLSTKKKRLNISRGAERGYVVSKAYVRHRPIHDFHVELNFSIVGSFGCDHALPVVGITGSWCLASISFWPLEYNTTTIYIGPTYEVTTIMKELFVISLLLCIYSIFAFTAPQRVLVRPYPVPNVHYGFDTSHSTTTPWKSSIWMTDDEIETEKVTVWKKVKNYIRGSNDGLTTKQRLAKLGLNAVLSYGWVSNMSYCVSVSLAWYIFSKRVST